MPDKFGDKIRLQHVLDAIETIQFYVSKASYQSFTEDPMMQDACIRQLQVIGEACNKVNKTLKQQHSEIPWNQIIGLRIIVIHEYFGVDDRVTWDVIQNDLPVLQDQVKKIILEVE